MGDMNRRRSMDTGIGAGARVAAGTVIASCDLSKPCGIRDRAILLLLARLGLRAGDITAMRLDDLDWHAGVVRVRGKGRKEVRLPLPQDAGNERYEAPPADAFGRPH